MAVNQDNQIEILDRRVQRERAARLAAESILEKKSLELYEANVELQRVALDLQAQMQKYQTIFESAAQGIVTVNLDWKISSFNPAAERIFQLSRTDVIGCEFHSLFKLDSNEPEWANFDADEIGSYDLVGKRSDGSEFFVELTTSVVQQKDAGVMVALIQDRTHQHQLEGQLRHAQKMESVGQLAAGIAHEINTPIQFVGDNIRFLSSSFDSIQQLLELAGNVESDNGNNWGTYSERRKALEDTIDLPFIRDEVPIAIQQSIEGIDRVATIVQAMKEFSHPGLADTSAVDINNSLISTVTVSRNEWKYYANIETDLDSELPLIQGFPGDLHQAFLNIIVNAAHAIEATGQFGEIAIATRRLDEQVEIIFTDNGCGIPAGNLDRMFEPFFTTKQVGKGTGQGLSVVHSVVVEKHGGTISVESTEGQGTSIRFLLPICSKSELKVSN